MPWKACDLMTLRLELLTLARQPDADRSALARRYGVSRKTLSSIEDLTVVAAGRPRRRPAAPSWAYRARGIRRLRRGEDADGPALVETWAGREARRGRRSGRRMGQDHQR